MQMAWHNTARLVQSGNRPSKASSKSCQLAHPGSDTWFDPCDDIKVQSTALDHGPVQQVVSRINNIDICLAFMLARCTARKMLAAALLAV